MQHIVPGVHHLRLVGLLRTTREATGERRQHGDRTIRVHLMVDEEKQTCRMAIMASRHGHRKSNQVQNDKFDMVFKLKDRGSSLHRMCILCMKGVVPRTKETSDPSRWWHNPLLVHNSWTKPWRQRASSHRHQSMLHQITDRRRQLLPHLLDQLVVKRAGRQGKTLQSWAQMKFKIRIPSLSQLNRQVNRKRIVSSKGNQQWEKHPSTKRLTFSPKRRPR